MIYCYPGIDSKDAAEYFNPLDPIDIVNKIEGLIDNEQKIKLLIKNGKKRLNTFYSSKERADKIINICKEIKNR